MNVATQGRTGRMSWAEALAGPLAGATCLWQDLDGVHRAPAPHEAPPTSILWAWSETHLVRVRLDGHGRDATAYVAVTAEGARGGGAGDGAAGGGAGEVHPFAATDRRILQLRPADGTEAEDLLVRWSYVTDTLPDGTGAVTFLRPA